MALHVDVIKNDWLAGIQYPLATFTLDDHGDITLSAQHPDRWQGLLDELTAQKDAAAALSDLHTRLNGSHLFATEAHDGTKCPFRTPVYLQGEEASGSASAILA